MSACFLPVLTAITCGGLLFAPSARGQTGRHAFPFSDYLVAPLRVHLLSAKAAPAIHTTLEEKDITRILGKVNGVWAQAGLHFYLESLVREEAEHSERFSPPGESADRTGLLELRPPQSKATNLFHIYYVKKMSVNGICFGDAIFVKDTASLREVPGGIDEPIPRVSSHELGHAFSLPHRQDTTNLMASGTTGTWLNEVEIAQARQAARKFHQIESAPELLKRANALFRANKRREAAVLYERLATMPLNAAEVALAKKRVARATRISPTRTQRRRERGDARRRERGATATLERGRIGQTLRLSAASASPR